MKHLVTGLALLLMLGVSVGSAKPAIGTARGVTSTAFCAANSISAQRHTGQASSRIAFKCRCCGRDENGHCNHQCCD